MRKKLFLIGDKPHNIFVALLNLLEVPHTTSFSNKYYKEHPYKYTLYGLAKMLSDYKIGNIGVRVKNKEEALEKLETPFIAHVGSDFVIVKEKNKDKVIYQWVDKTISVTSNQFFAMWSGAALVIDSIEDAREPNYKANRSKEQINIWKYISMGASSLMITLLFLCFYNTSQGTGFIFLLLVNLIGLSASFLLLLQQLNIQNGYVDKICSLLLDHSDCNSILESKGARFLGLINWSEIGFGYFISNLVALIFRPELCTAISIGNLLALPYTFWSVWYQKKIAKQWCSLCLIVQLTIWGVFFVSLENQFFLPIKHSIDFILLGSLYVLVILITNIIAGILTESTDFQSTKYELNVFKANEDVFISLLKKEKYYQGYEHASTILFGNVDAKNVITIITNPHCNPCAQMHERAMDIISSGKFCLQYIYTSFNEELEDSCMFLIALYQSNNDEVNNILSEWFKYGKLDRLAFFKKYPLDIKNNSIKEEFCKHKEFVTYSQIMGTPTVLFNGYKLPESYKIEDLTHFSNIDYK